jgi:mannose-6-phosphate isomerase
VDAPLRFRPFLRPLVWGGRRLGEVLHKSLPATGSFGEAWEVSDHASHHSSLDGKDGRTLRDLMESEKEALLGPAASAYRVFPWLVKFLDANDWLSVQVHPDEEAVVRLWPGEGSKTEAWFILDAAPGSRVYAGLLPGVDEKRLRQALAAGTVADCLHQFHPRPGDCLFLRAGTVHAVGGGVLMAEVQQTSDATFRLFDWNRTDATGKPRQLHIEEAIRSIHWDAGPVRPVHANGYPVPGARGGASVRQELVRCRYFVLEYVRQNEPFSLGGAGRLQVAIGLHGRSALETAGGGNSFGAGDTLLLPAALGPTQAIPAGPFGFLVATLPDQGAGG